MGNSIDSGSRDFRSLTVGDRYFVQKGDATSDILPKPAEGFYWDLDERSSGGDYYRFSKKDEPRVVGTTENLEQIIKDREETIRDLSSKVTLVTGDLGRAVRARDKAIQEKNAITEAFDERGREIEDLKNQIDIWEQQYKDLSSAMKETDKLIFETAKEADVNPEWREYENLQKEKLRLENEKLRLDNKVTWHKLRGSEDYPISLWHQTEYRLSVVDKFKGWLIGLYGAVVAICVNEVIQWLTR